jgi:hypothetical protein
MKNKEVISRLRNTLKEMGRDSVLTNKYLHNVLKTAAIFLIKREANNKKFIYNQTGIWSTYYVHMIPVPLVQDFNIPTDCVVYKSKEKLPSLIETDYGWLYKQITALGDSLQFTLVTPYVNSLKSKVKGNKNKYVWIENGYLYSSYHYPVLKLLGLFEEDITPFNKDANCSKLEDTFIGPDYLVDAIIKLALQELQMTKQIPLDPSQNSNTSN